MQKGGSLKFLTPVRGLEKITTDFPTLKIEFTRFSMGFMAKRGAPEIFLRSEGGGDQKHFVINNFASGPPPLQVFVNGPQWPHFQSEDVEEEVLQCHFDENELLMVSSRYRLGQKISWQNFGRFGPFPVGDTQRSSGVKISKCFKWPFMYRPISNYSWGYKDHKNIYFAV